MADPDFWTIAASIGSATNVVVAFIYGALYLAARKQIAATIETGQEQAALMQRTSQYEMYLRITNSLSVDPVMRQARWKLREYSASNDWKSDTGAVVARQVCAAFNVAAVMVRERVIPEELFREQYAAAVRELCDQVQSAGEEVGLSAYGSLWQLAQHYGAGQNRHLPLHVAQDAEPCGQPDLAHRAAQGRLP